MQTTALVQEVHLRMAEQAPLRLESRSHALRFAARVMLELDELMEDQANYGPRRVRVDGGCNGKDAPGR